MVWIVKIKQLQIELVIFQKHNFAYMLSILLDSFVLISNKAKELIL